MSITLNKNKRNRYNQEVKRDSKGRFPKGVCGNPNGRPKGIKSRLNQLREGLLNAIEDEFGSFEAYFRDQSKAMPKELIALIGKVMPRNFEVTDDTEEKQPIVIIDAGEASNTKNSAAKSDDL